MDASYSRSVNNWVKFANTKRVQNLELNFTDLQLTKLTLVIPAEVTNNLLYHKMGGKKLNNLKHLELHLAADCGYPLGYLTYLIKRAPNLSKFVMKLLSIGMSWGYSDEGFSYDEYSNIVPKKYYHEMLQEIEFIGFVGLRVAFMLAVKLLEVSRVLTKMTIDTRHPGMMNGP